MSAPVQYLTASDGVTIAYSAQGGGRSCLYLQPISSHLDRAWDVDALRRSFDWLSAYRRLVRTDYRGTGLSQRGAVPLSVERIADDLEHILAQLDAGPTAVIAFGPSTLVATTLAHRFPARVERLILTHPVVAGEDFLGAAGMSELQTLADSNWELFTVLSSTMVFGASDARTDQQAVLMRAAMTPVEWAAHMQALRRADTAPLLPHIGAPVLVVLPDESLVAQPNSVRNVAALLPDARVVAMQGKYVARVLEDPPTLAAIAAFLDIPDTMHSRVGGESTAGILFTDIADSTALTEQLGDVVFRRRARELDERLRELIRDGGGRSIDGKLLGRRGRVTGHRHRAQPGAHLGRVGLRRPRRAAAEGRRRAATAVRRRAALTARAAPEPPSPRWRASSRSRR